MSFDFNSSDGFVWRALIIDDSASDRLSLKQMLKEHPEIQIIGEAQTLTEAAELCETLKPDLIFLDIQLQNSSGFDLLTKISTLPAIIFVTAYPQFAVRAFEIHAVDYLVKPVYAERLALTVSRLHSQIPLRSSEDSQKPFQQDITILPISRNFHVVPTRQISCLRADANYSIVTLSNGKEHLIYRSLQQWEAFLPLNIFFRLNRSLIIAPAHLEKTKIIDRDNAQLFITGVTIPLEIGRTTLTRLKKIFGTIQS